MSPNHYQWPHKSLVKGRDCDCCEWCENGANTLYLMERVGYDILLFSAVIVSLALMLVIHLHSISGLFLCAFEVRTYT